jgi:hypothetical protein
LGYNTGSHWEMREFTGLRFPRRQYPSAEADNASTKRGNGDGARQSRVGTMEHVWESAKRGALGFFEGKEKGVSWLSHLGVGDVKWWDVLAGEKGVDAALQHTASKVKHNRLGFKLEVA